MNHGTPKRCAPQNPGQREAQPRDLVGLAWLARAQPITTGQFCRYLGMSRPVGWRALRRLRDLGLVEVHVTGMEQDNAYTLAAGGARLLARVHGRASGDYRLLRGPVSVNAHHRAVVDVATGLACASMQATSVHAAEFTFEAELRRRVHNAKDALVPDAVAVLHYDVGTIAYAIEIDLGEENPSLLSRKFAALHELRRVEVPLVGVADWRVLVVVPTERRLHRLALGCAADARVPPGLVSFAVSGDLEDATILDQGWWEASVDASGKHVDLTMVSPFRGARATRSDGSNSLTMVASGSSGDLADRFGTGGAR